MIVALLFDLDGTLVKGAGAGGRAMREAVRRWVGEEADPGSTSMAGRTDPYIFRELLARAGVTSETVPEGLIDVYLECLRREVERTPGELLPGIRDVVEKSAGDGRFRLALATGNIERGARIKLEPHGLNEFFPVGGYGSDSGERDALVAAALHRVRQAEGDAEIPGIVIGDTPRDVAAAHANGMPCIAVATGPYGVDALSRAGADAVLPDLGNPDAFFRAVREYM